MVRVHSGLPLNSLNLLGRHRQVIRNFGKLVTRSHQLRKFRYCFPESRRPRQFLSTYINFNKQWDKRRNSR